MSDILADAKPATGGDRAAVPAPAHPLRRAWRVLLWLTVAGLAGWVLVRWTGYDRRTPLTQLISYTPYVAMFAVVVLVLALATRQRLPAVAALVLVVLFGAFTLPRVVPDTAFGKDRSIRDGRMLRVMSFNTLGGNGSAAAAVELIRKTRPEVLAVQELSPDWVEEFAAAGGDELFPYHALRPLPGVAGTGIWARYPLTGARGVDTRTTFDQTRALLQVPGRPVVEVVSAHPAALPQPQISPGSAPRGWLRDFRLLPTAPRSGPVRVLAGDFNATLDHSVFRNLLDTGYLDAAATVGHGWEGTWPELGHPVFPPVTIDHVLVDRRADPRSFHTHLIPGSDHKAVIADLMLPGN